MEPNDVNPDRALETALHRSQPDPLADAGFTATLLRRLPARRAAAATSWDFHAITLWAAVAAGVLIVASHSSLNAEAYPVLRSLNESLAPAWRPMGIATSVLVSLYGVLGWGHEKSRDH